MGAVEVPPLIEILAEVPDKRESQGKRHPLEGMLTLACVATLCGYKNPNAISEWGRNYGEEYAAEFGFEEHGYPATSSWYRILGEVDVEAVEEVLTGWCERILSNLTSEELQGISIDGKTLRGSKRQEATNSHLLSAYVHEIGIVLAQTGVDDKTNELGEIEDFLLGLALKGRVVTADALLTQQNVADTIVKQGGDYVLPVKKNQELTHQAIEFWFDAPAPPEQQNTSSEVIEKQHGRLTHWHIETSTALNSYLNWPGLKQVFKITRRVTSTRTGETQTEIRYGMTSLSSQRAGPATLLSFTREHWSIENRLHWVRDVTFGEDRSVLRVGQTHHIMATLRNLAISLLRLHGYSQIASSLRLFAAQPYLALALVSKPLLMGE